MRTGLVLEEESVIFDGAEDAQQMRQIVFDRLCHRQLRILRHGLIIERTLTAAGQSFWLSSVLRHSFNTALTLPRAVEASDKRVAWDPDGSVRKSLNVVEPVVGRS